MPPAAPAIASPREAQSLLLDLEVAADEERLPCGLNYPARSPYASLCPSSRRAVQRFQERRTVGARVGWEAERGAQQIDRGSARLVIFQFSRNRRPLRILWGNNIGSCTTVDVSERALPLRHTTLTVDVKRGTNRLCTTPEPTPRVALVYFLALALPLRKGRAT